MIAEKNKRLVIDATFQIRKRVLAYPWIRLDVQVDVAEVPTGA